MLTTTIALGVLVVTASASATTTVLRGDPDDSILPANVVVTGTGEGRATITFPSIGDLSCHPHFATTFATTQGNPTIDGTLASLTFASCTDTIPLIAIDDCNLHAGHPTVLAAAQSISGGAVTLGDMTMFCHVTGSGTPGTGCYWRFTDPTGSYMNATHTLSFPSVSADHTVPATTSNDLGSACPTTGTFSVRFAHVHSSAGSTVTLTTT